MVGRAHGAGLRVILDMHNYAGYYEQQSGHGVRRNLGDPGMLRSFADVWRRMGRTFRTVPGVLGFDLMNEPVNVSGTTVRNAATGKSSLRRWSIGMQPQRPKPRQPRTTKRC